MEDIIINNILIAKFMAEKVDEGGMTGYDWDDLEYHYSWDWLIPVIKKIATIEPDNIGKMQQFNPYTYDIDRIYKGVVEYIKSYNHKTCN